MKKLSYIFVGLMLFYMASCSDNTYLNAIPAESTALISIDPVKMSGINNVAVLKTLLHVTNMDKSGIDASHKIFLFTAPDGNLGLCAKVKDADDLNETFKQLSGKGLSTAPIKRRGFRFAVLKDVWVAGWNEQAILVMGPVTPDAQAALQQQISQYLKQDEADGVTNSRLYAKLDSIDAPMAMVAQAAALPEQFVVPFTLGAPKDADASQVMVAAEITTKKQLMQVNGTTFSFNKRINKALQDARQVFRPISGKYIACYPKDAVLGMFMNVDGRQFLPIMQANKSLQALLTGINTAIDMDNILRSVYGELVIATLSDATDRLSMGMTAELIHKRWTKDVAYWKESCPKGGRIEDWGPDIWHYTSDKTNFYFGVTANLQFFCSSKQDEESTMLMPVKDPLSTEVADLIKGKKLALVINLQAMQGEKAGAVMQMLRPIFGNIDTIVYTLK